MTLSPHLYIMIRFLFFFFLTGNCFAVTWHTLHSLILKSLIFPSLLTAGISLGIEIRQFPSAVIKKVNDDVQLLCTHDKSDYRVMLWYQRLPGETALKLVGYGYTQFKDDSVEEPFRESFKLEGDLNSDKKNGSLFINKLKAPEHTATYFCAASQPQYIKHPSALNKNLFPCLLLQKSLLVIIFSSTKTHGYRKYLSRRLFG